MHTTPQVLEETGHAPLAQARLEALQVTRRLAVSTPTPEALARVEGEAARRGEELLSPADLSIVALALDLRAAGLAPTVVSDDYGVQNLSAALGVTWRPISTRGIASVWAWRIYCPGCGKVFRSTRRTECDVCGTRLRRKPEAKRPA